MLRHDYTHHVRELNRLLWVALASGRPGRLGLTEELRAELRTDREPAFGPEGPGREDIEAALAKSGGKVTPAARLLGLKNRYALYRLMERYGIRAAEEGSDADG